MRQFTNTLILMCALCAGLVPAAQAQNNASTASELSLMPLGSVVGASVGAVVTLPVAFSVAGAVLVVKGVEASATGTQYVLERVSDGARASVEVSGKVASAASTTVGTVVSVSIISAGVVLSVAGQVLAFVPNEAGRALFHNQRVTL